MKSHNLEAPNGKLKRNGIYCRDEIHHRVIYGEVVGKENRVIAGELGYVMSPPIFGSSIRPRHRVFPYIIFA